MKKSPMAALALAALAATFAGCSTMSLKNPQARRQFADTVIGNWSSFSRLAAAGFMEEYGAPDQVRHDQLIWNDKGPWKRIKIWNVTPYYDSDLGADNIEQTVAYLVPQDKHKELNAFSHEILISQNGTELSARGTSETADFLTLNLADDIVLGRKTPEEARRFYEQTIQLSLAGKASPYLRGLIFTPSPAELR